MCVWSVADAPRAGSAEAKPCGSLPPCSPARDAPRAGSAEAKLSAARCRTARPDAPRAGSAEAKVFSARRAYGERGMHPVQAAPRQSPAARCRLALRHAMHPVQAAPRQREAKGRHVGFRRRCTPCRQRRGKDDVARLDIALQRCTPCRQRRGKGVAVGVAGVQRRCTPCRQRRGKVACSNSLRTAAMMHPVQAAPRQRWTICIIKAHKKRCTPCRQRRGKVRR